MIKYIGTSDNAVGILTKPLKGISTSKMAQLIGLGMPSRGGVEDLPAFKSDLEGLPKTPME